jgi:hypothetical protein
MHDHDCDCPRTAGFDSDAPAAASRRSFLRTSGLLGAGAAALSLAGPATAASAATASEPSAVTGRWRPDTSSPRFTLVVMPDTQYLFDEDRIHPEPLEASFRYILSGEENVVFLAHLGDVTQNGQANEFAAVSKVFDALDEQRVAYSVLAGNHDINGSTTDQRGDTPYLDTFNPKRFSRSGTFKGADSGGYNTYHVFTAGGREWLLLALDWRLSTEGFAWANSVIAANPTLPVIVTTHEIAGSYSDGTAGLSSYGQQLWDGLINDNDQVFLTLNGHYWPPGNATMRNKAGHDVHVHITNYQNRYYGGAAMIRAYRFDLERNTIDVSTFSPWIMDMAAEQRNLLASQEMELTTSVDYFSMQLDFAQRFAGFDPIPVRAPRPANEMLVKGTVAYWRFDSGTAEGAPVTTTVKDLTGLGNDLTRQNVSGSAASTLTWSRAYHPDQPGHGSLYFDGQGSPLSGAWLQTATGAPLNANTFAHGYTFEAFFKLPNDWNSSTNAWTAILSRWGTAGEAGKSGGNTDPNEPIVTLSLSGDRELQWCVYPLNQTDESTNWGHELPIGDWWHVAVVNDGKLTTVYVDGCPVVRNPSLPAVGLTTLNLPWLLGGYEYSGTINQIFHGYIGDVRIVNRPLKVTDFMIS